MREKMEKAKQDKKRLEEQKKKDLELFATAITQPKVPFGLENLTPGTDPKSLVCNFWKVGKCNKGDRCKFAHDLNAGRKTTKKDIYSDAREGEENKDDNMENWDQTKLEEAIAKREIGRENLNKATDIVCKFFLDAIEDQKYGWFWDWYLVFLRSPNGLKCKYRHALPPGFVLKKKETEEERREREAREKANEITIEEFLEKEVSYH